MIAHIDLDMVLDGTRNRMGRLCVQGPARSELTTRSLRSKVLEEVGPGGGHPLVRVIGSRTAIVKYLAEVYCDADDLGTFVALIKEGS